MSQPLVVRFGYKEGRKGLRFVGRNGDIRFQMQRHRDDLIRVLGLCNGIRTFAQIREKLSGISDETFSELMDLAEEFGIIVDSRNLYFDFHEDSANPMRFSRKMSPAEASVLADEREQIPRSENSIELQNTSEGNFLQLCSKRKTSRVFSSEALGFEHISGLLRAMYTVGSQRSTPSAGQLYPLDIYVAVMADSAEIAKGLYRYDPEHSLLNPIETTAITRGVLARVLNGHDADNAPIVIFIAANLERHATKYANRGYRFTLIESGHAAQNAYLYCAETKNLGIVEYGGFQDRLTAELLGLNYPKESVLLALIIGYQGNSTKEEPSHTSVAWDLNEQLVGHGKPIEYLLVSSPTHGKYKLPKIQVLAKYRHPSRQSEQIIADEECYGSGLAATSDESQIKAIAEGYERYASGSLFIDVVSSANKLKTPWLDPRQIVPLQPLAFQRHAWSEFRPEIEYQWVTGRRYVDDEPTLVPVDLVFYPLSSEQLGRKLCYSATSSGVAAHTDVKIAAEKALLELIERDAMSVSWYSERSISAIPISSLSEDIRLRTKHWIKKGWQVKFIDLTIDTVPVVLCLIYSPTKFPSFVAGAAANPQWAVAAEKAWDEAEIFLLNWCRKKPKPQALENVFGPLHHGMLYFVPENLKHVERLLDAEEVHPTWGQVQNMSDILSQINPVLIDLTHRELQCGLKVIRAISEKLLPINFGFGNEHLGHRRLRDLGLTWKREFPSFPHFFA